MENWNTCLSAFSGVRIGYASVGFGLGLAIAARAVQMHGGSIVARNESGGGLTVEVNLHNARSLHDITLA